MTDLVTMTRDLEAYVGIITLGDDARRNAFGADIVGQFNAALKAFEDDDAIKAIVVRAQGANLSVGASVSDAVDFFKAADASEGKRKLVSQRERLARGAELWWGPDGLCQRLLRCTKVTVVAARGDCLETGLYLALYADLTVADQSARFGNPKWVQIGVDGDVSMLIAAVGLRRAKEIIYCNRIWSAAQALDYGLVDAVVSSEELDRRAFSLARDCATIMRDAIAAEKAVVAASLGRMQVGMGLSAGAVLSGYATNVHFRDGEFNMLKAVRDHGQAEAREQAGQYFEF